MRSSLTRHHALRLIRFLGVSAVAMGAAMAVAQDASTPAGIEPPRIPPVQPLPETVPTPAAPVVAPSAAGAALDAPVTVPGTPGVDPEKVYGPRDPEARARVPAPAGVPGALAEAVTKASTEYPAVRAVEGQVRSAGKDISAAKWQRFASVSLEGVGFQGGNQNAARSNLGINLTVDQPLLTFGRIENNIKRAEASQDVARGQLLETRQQVALAVVQSYYQMVSTARRNEIMLAGKQALIDLTDSIGRRVEQGVSPAADRILAQSRVSQLDQDIATNQANFFSARERYRQLTGETGATLRQIPTYDAGAVYPSAEGAFVELQACDPKRQRLQAETQVAIAQAKVAKAQIYPQISGQFQQSEILGTRAGLVVKAQTSGGFSQVASAESARIKAETSQFQVAVNDRESREALAQDLVENISARDRISASGTAAVAAKDVTESYRRQFVAGRRTWLDVVNAEREAINSELSQADSEVSAMGSAARILLRTCRWQP